MRYILTGCLLTAGLTAGVLAQADSKPKSDTKPAVTEIDLKPAAPEDPALGLLRTAHETALKARMDGIRKRELEALRAMEKARVDKGDYAGAQSVLQKIEEIEKSLGTTIDPSTQPVILNSAGNCLMDNGIVLKNKGFLIPRAPSTIRWEGLNVKPGNYLVRMTYSVGEPDVLGTVENPIRFSRMRADGTALPPPSYGGAVSFQEETSINAGDPLLKRIQPTSILIPEATEDLGTIKISSSRTALSLKAVRSQSHGVMHLKKIELWPVKETASSDEPKEFKILREDYRKAIAEKTGSAHRYWLTKLLELEKQSTETSNTQALEIIKPELARVTKIVMPQAPGVETREIYLSAPDPIIATYKGEIRLSTGKDSLQRIRPVGARVSFNLAAGKVVPGKYNVQLEVNVGPGMGGSYRLSCLGQNVQGEIQTSQAYVKRTIHVPGTLTIAADARYLDFEVGELTSSTGSLCELRTLHLIPAN